MLAKQVFYVYVSVCLTVCTQLIGKETLTSDFESYLIRKLLYKFENTGWIFDAILCVL